MRTVENFKYSDFSYNTGYANYHTTTTAGPTYNDIPTVIYGSIPADYSVENKGKYSVLEIANWFLSKAEISHLKLQKLCYYAQAWNYALKGFRLEDTDYQAWVHGPVSPALYEHFKVFGYEGIRLKGEYKSRIDEDDKSLLEDVWATYGNLTGNALEALSHRELPWISARRGYMPGERCSVIISPESMASYYRSIYRGKE